MINLTHTHNTPEESVQSTSTKDIDKYLLTATKAAEITNLMFNIKGAIKPFKVVGAQPL